MVRQGKCAGADEEFLTQSYPTFPTACTGVGPYQHTLDHAHTSTRAGSKPPARTYQQKEEEYRWCWWWFWQWCLHPFVLTLVLVLVRVLVPPLRVVLILLLALALALALVLLSMAGRTPVPRRGWLG